MTISTYFTNLKGLWDELERHQMLPTYNQMTTNNKETKEDCMMQFLMALNNTYNGVHNNILMMTSLPNARQAYALVIQDDTQQQMTSRPTENFSIAAAIQSRSKGFSNDSTNKHCEHYDRGHTIENHWTLKVPLHIL